MAEETTDSDGRTWTVRRRWVPKLPGETLGHRFRRRLSRRSGRRRNLSGLGDVSTLLGDAGSGIGGIIAAIALVVALAITVVVVLVLVVPLLVAVVELAALALLAVLAVGLRVLFRRPWTVEAVCDDGTVLTWRVVGWRASGAQVTNAARSLHVGPPPPGAATSHLAPSDGTDTDR